MVDRDGSVDVRRYRERGLFPDNADVVVVTDFAEAQEILRSNDFEVAFGATSPHVVVSADRVRVIPNRGITENGDITTWQDWFHGMEVHFLEEPAHTQRRRALAPLFARDAHIWFATRIIDPHLRRSLAAVLDRPDADGIARTDLVPFVQQLATQIAAALVGIDGVEDPAAIERLVELTSAIDRELVLIHDRPAVDEATLEAALNDAVAAREAFRREFFEPSLHSRRSLLERHARGEVEASQLPHDMIMLVARDSAVLREADAVPQATALLSPTISGHTSQLLHVLADILDGAPPTGPEPWTDPEFMHAAISESIRLHHPGVIPRRAAKDRVLASGRSIRSGQYVAIVQRLVDRDPAIFGETSATYDPHRELPPGVQRFGLGFGSGSHMCIAHPLVMGQAGISGTIAPIVTALLASGVARDPSRPARLLENALPFREIYETFPVTFSRGAHA